MTGGPCLRRWFRRLHDLVRFVRRGRGRGFDAGSEIRGPLVKGGWPVAPAYVIGFFVMLALLGWNPKSF